MSFLIYVIGFVLLIAGIAWALAVVGVATVYIAIACLILLGLGILTGATRTRHRDPPTT
jgi:hypothetical protein